MNLPATTGWRGLVASAIGAALLGTAAAAEPPQGKAKVIFSDSSTNDVRVDVATPSPMFQGKAEAPRRGGSSLDGVGAVPFSPVPGFLPGAMSRRDRELREAHDNWILNPGKGLAMSEENVNRAFGVRSAETKETGQEPDRPATFWESYFNKANDAPTLVRPPALLPPYSSDRTGAESSYRSLLPEASSFDSALLPFMDRERGRALFSDAVSRPTVPNGVSDAFDANRRDLVRDSLNFTAATPGMRTESRAAERAEQFRRLLGMEPSGRPDTGTPVAATVGTLTQTEAGRQLPGPADLLGVTPDPTRRELNPVIARPAPDFGASTRLTVSESISGLNRPTAAARPSMIDISPVRLPQPAATSVDISSGNQARRVTHSPTTLEIPRRSF